MTKTESGRFFEDFAVGEDIHHATPRTVTEADAALYLALTGSRFGIHCSETLARTAGLPRSPIEDLLTFHLVFGRSVPDISLNAVANLGYADGLRNAHPRTKRITTLSGPGRVADPAEVFRAGDNND